MHFPSVEIFLGEQLSETHDLVLSQNWRIDKCLPYWDAEHIVFHGTWNLKAGDE